MPSVRTHRTDPFAHAAHRMRGGCIPRSMQARSGSLINSVRSPKLAIGSIIIVLLRRGRRAERFCHLGFFHAIRRQNSIEESHRSYLLIGLTVQRLRGSRDEGAHLADEQCLEVDIDFWFG